MATYNESAEPAGSLRAPAHNFDLGQHGREEARRLLDAWNETRQQYSYQLCVPQLVAACATVIPGAVALVAGDHVLTYGELNERANRLAHYLRAHGVGPEVLVGLCLDRSLELVVALLGILKAGGAYVPLDPAYPPARLAAMLTDAAPPVLLTQQRHHERLPSEPAQGPHVCCVDRDAALLAGYSAADPPPLATPDHLAYVIYTSGSSGQPKGVEITHRSLLNLIFWHQSAFEVRQPTGRRRWRGRPLTRRDGNCGPISPPAQASTSPTTTHALRPARCATGCWHRRSPFASCRRRWRKQR